MQKTVLTNEFKRDPVWSSLKVRRMARFLSMRPTQVYKWNWNRKRARITLGEGTSEKLSKQVLKMIKSQIANGPGGEMEIEEEDEDDGGLNEMPDPSLEAQALSKISHLSKHRREVLEALADFDDEHFMARCKKESDMDDILLFKIERNAERAPHLSLKSMSVNKSGNSIVKRK